MRLSIKIIVGAAIVAASVAAATFGASAPAAAAEQGVRASRTEAVMDMSARKKSVKKQQGTSLRVSKLSRRAAEPPNPDRPYYRPVPHFFPFAQDRGYF
jgi:ribulose kinase